MSAPGNHGGRSGPRSWIASAVACGLLLVACAGGGPGTGAPGTGAPGTPLQGAATSTAAPATGAAPDACSLLSKAEVEAAVGNPVADGVPDVANACRWEKGDPSAISVGLHLLGLSGGEKCAAGQQGSTPVTGLGVDASWSFVALAETGSVVACPAGWQVQVTLVGDLVKQTTSEAALRAAGEKLMGLVLGRL